VAKTSTSAHFTLRLFSSHPSKVIRRENGAFRRFDAPGVIFGVENVFFSRGFRNSAGERGRATPRLQDPGSSTLGGGGPPQTTRARLPGQAESHRPSRYLGASVSHWKGVRGVGRVTGELHVYPTIAPLPVQSETLAQCFLQLRELVQASVETNERRGEGRVTLPYDSRPCLEAKQRRPSWPASSSGPDHDCGE
jgi:hypothetical protein